MAENKKLYVLSDLKIGRIDDIFSKYGPCKITKEGAFYVVVYDDYRDCHEAFVYIVPVKNVCCAYTKEKAQAMYDGKHTIEDLSEESISET